MTGLVFSTLVLVGDGRSGWGSRVGSDGRVVLATGISLVRADGDGPPDPDALDPLDAAPEHAATVQEALGRFGYVPAVADQDLDAAVRAAAAGSARALVVHVVGHGRLDDGTGELFVLGPDGEPIEAPVDDWIKAIERRRPGTEPPSTLFVLDMCHAGAPLEAAWSSLLHADRRRAWVMAASGTRDRAYDFRLSRAVARVLDRYAGGELQVDPSLEFIPLDKVGMEVARVVAELGAGSPGVQVVRSTPVGFAAFGVLDRLPFLPNPRWTGADEQLSGVEEALRPFLDEGVDEEHFASRASGTPSTGVHSALGYFRGRRAQLRELSAWLDSADSGCRVVTGKPGVGKSALLGVLVCAAHPQLRSRYAGLWRHLLPDVPSANPLLAAVHARQRSTRQIMDSIARQLASAVGLPTSADATVETLLDLVSEGGHPATVVIDALDEAQNPREVLDQLLLPLLNVIERGILPGVDRKAGSAAARIRLLIGTRREAAFADLFNQIRGPQGQIIDLGQVSPLDLRESVSAYIAGLLADSPWYGSLAGSAAADAFAQAAAERLTEEPLEWGEFLAAGLLARQYLDSPPAADPERARESGLRAPRELPDLLRLDLARSGQPANLGPVLTALAFTLGRGMPERVLAHVAGAFSPSLRGPLPIEQVRAGLAAGRFYLRRDIERDGTTLYRLFHESLAQTLRARPLGPGGTALAADPADPPRPAVYRALLTAVPTPEGVRDWSTADPYVLDHLASHAVQAGEVDQLIEDEEFLVLADPESLGQALPAVRSARGGRIASIYRASLPVHRVLPPAGRRQILALDAIHAQEPELAHALTSRERWNVRWTADRWNQVMPRTLGGHADWVSAVAIFDLDGRPHAVTSSYDTTARVWDLTTGACRHTLAGHTHWVRAVAVAQIEGRPHAVTTGDDHTARVWDLTTGACLRALTGHTDWVRAVAVTQINGRPHVVTAGDDHTARVWDLTTGACLRALTGHTDNVRGLLAIRIDGRPHAITAADDGLVRVWDIEAGECRHTLAGRDSAQAVGFAEIDARPHAVTVHGSRALVWDLTTGRCVRRIDHGHTAAVRAMKLAEIDGRLCAITTGDDDTARVWDVETGALQRILAGHTDSVSAVTTVEIAGHPHAVTGSRDGTARVWSIATIDRSSDGRSASVFAVVAAEIDGRPHVVANSFDGVTRVWDLETGECRRTLTGRSQWVSALVAAEIEGLPHVITTSDDTTARVWDLTTGECRHVLAGHTEAVSAAATVEIGGRPHAVTTGKDATTRVWDLTTGECRRTLGGASEWVSAARSWVSAVATALIAGKPHAVTTSRDRVVRVWNLETGECRYSLSGHTQWVFGVTIAEIKGHPHAVTLADDRTARVWDLRRGECRHVLTGHRKALSGATATEIDGRPHLITISEDFTARVWDLETGECRHVLAGHTEWVCTATAIRLDGRPHVVTTGNDRTMRVWDLETGLERDVLHLPHAAYAVTVTPEPAATVVLGAGTDVIVIQPNPNRTGRI